ncbi:LysM peptidoglycan-binding domain-containing protein [Actinocrispum wychmicini]|uniref:LysM domain-containing protein n=1 Tax=Actinocrispum wychmicini TaxID=1213861 RepID=A0A4R2J3M8_9PSEU|nr:LysM peptidoglycan-binding domain-containing protein [Actinocrispum wychmicini]TCO52624.1 LysM domain-containing protein [Actinocrispum wychmicini]
MAAPVRTNVDLSELDSRPVLRLVPPLAAEPQARPRPKRRAPRRSNQRRPSARRLPDCPPRRRRLRLSASFVIGLTVFLGVVLVGFAAGSMAGDRVPDRVAVVWVQPGETLWDVATRVAPDYDTEAVMARIRELNDVPADGVLAGQALEVPASR